MHFHKSPYVLALCASLLHTSAARFNGGSGQNGGQNGASTSVDTAVAASTSVSSSSIAANGGGSASSSSVAALSSASASAGTSTNSTAAGNVNNANGGNNNNNNNNGGASASVNGGSSLTLDANAVQTGSESNGLQNAAAGQAASATDNANFINFCSGKQLTNGLQVTGGSCNGIVMGDIPSSSNMISTIITSPGPGDTIAANQDFNVNLQVANLVAGSFTNPDTTYYAAPQALEGGKIVGHTHVTIQSLGNNIATTTPPDAGTFAFFKGINDAGDGNGGLTAAVTGGLPAGVYRVCTMTSASNHQPVTMPVAQRGAQDDCNKFTVTDGGANTSANTTSSSSSGNANTGSGSANANGSSSSSASSAASNGNTNTATAASAAGSATSATSAASNASSSASTTGNTGNQNGGRGGGRGNRGRFTSRKFIA